MMCQSMIRISARTESVFFPTPPPPQGKHDYLIPCLSLISDIKKLVYKLKKDIGLYIRTAGLYRPRLMLFCHRLVFGNYIEVEQLRNSNYSTTITNIKRLNK